MKKTFEGEVDFMVLRLESIIECYGIEEVDKVAEFRGKEVFRDKVGGETLYCLPLLTANIRAK
jgi:hypothetical protein